MKTEPRKIETFRAAAEQLPAAFERCGLELEESRRRAERAEALFANVADAVLVSEPDGPIVDVNPAACEVLGYSREELLKMHPWDFVTSASREEILKLIQEIRPGTSVTVQRTYRRKNGELKIMDLRLARCAVAGRDLIIVYCRDVTERQQLEARLRRSEKNLAEGQRLTKTGSWILDFEAGNTDWSVETCRIFGFPDPPPSPHYDEFRSRVRPEDREGVDRGLRESFETGEPRPLKYVFVLPDGVRKHIETISERVRDETGELRLMGTVMDVTERVEAEESLKQTASALRNSEQCARAQAEALTRILDALARESSSDRVVEHVLRTVTGQLGAASSSVWLKEKDTDLMIFEFSLEEGKFSTKANADLAAVSPSVRVNEVWPWPEVFRTGKPFVLEDIREGPDFPWRHHVLSQGVICVLVVPMLIAGQVEGVIGVRFAHRRAFRNEELELGQALAHQAMLAVQLMRLSQQSREAAIMAERNRMARDMHDTLAQGFTGVIMQLEAAKGAASQGKVGEVTNRIERAGELARESIGEARRSVRALRPRSLWDGTLSLALEDLLKRMSDGTGLTAEFKAEGNDRVIPNDQEEALLRVTQEALTNTLKHAKARNFKAALGVDSEKILLQLVDDGKGFEPQSEHDGFGLVGMKERVDQLGGQFILRSKPGLGTEIVVAFKSPATLKGRDQDGQV